MSDRVLIRHLPSALTHHEKSDLLCHFGAVDVTIVGPEAKKSNLVFARFESSKAAEMAVQRLHQLSVLGQRISVEVARGLSTAAAEPVDVSPHPARDEKQDKILKARETFLKKFGLSIKNYDFNQPPPLNIYYQYPPPTKLVLENICKAMANTPKLYTQVLHLMNKMGLPCPFTKDYPMESDLFNEKQTTPVTDDRLTVVQEQRTEETFASESESEMGSDTEQRLGEIIPVKRKRGDKKVMKKRPKFVKPQVPTHSTTRVGLRPDDVFEGIQKEPQIKKIELKITSDLSSIQTAQEIQAVESTEEGFQVVKAPLKVQETPTEPENKEDSGVDDGGPVFITSEQLAANRISTKDQRVLPVFKNYQAGAPSCRLYIKNLAKQVQTRDLHFIFRRYYRPELDEQGSMFDIRLMQEGRMKGQAFVTLQSVGQAQAALRETNGYILRDKPMVVQYARSASTSTK